MGSRRYLPVVALAARGELPHHALEVERMGTEPPAVRRCGRPTRSGGQCRAQIYGRDVACRQHTTEHEREVLDAYEQGWREGLRQGQQSGNELRSLATEHLERRIAALEQQLDEKQRVYEVAGDQAVEVGGYSYRWAGHPPLAVGDRVLLPENWLSGLKDGPGSQTGVVTRLGTTYRGQLSRIVGRASD
jgi:hypothetical protein